MEIGPSAYNWCQVKSSYIRALYFDPASHRIYAKTLDGDTLVYEDCMWNEWGGVTQKDISVGWYVTRVLRKKSHRTLTPSESATLSLILDNWGHSQL